MSHLCPLTTAQTFSARPSRDRRPSARVSLVRDEQLLIMGGVMTAN